MPDARLRVVISYSHTDATFADQLEQDLKAHQFQTWIDRRNLEHGQDWADAIKLAINECLALVVILSPAAVQSQWVRLEYRHAVAQGKPVIPGVYRSTPRVPRDLRAFQWVDFQPDYEQGLRQLVQALGSTFPVHYSSIQ